MSDLLDQNQPSNEELREGVMNIDFQRVQAQKVDIDADLLGENLYEKARKVFGEQALVINEKFVLLNSVLDSNSLKNSATIHETLDIFLQVTNALKAKGLRIMISEYILDRVGLKEMLDNRLPAQNALRATDLTLISGSQAIPRMMLNVFNGSVLGRKMGIFTTTDELQNLVEDYVESQSTEA